MRTSSRCNGRFNCDSDQIVPGDPKLTLVRVAQMNPTEGSVSFRVVGALICSPGSRMGVGRLRLSLGRRRLTQVA